MKKRICMILSLILIIGLFPVVAFAEESIDEERVKEQSTEETVENKETSIPSVLSIQVDEEDEYCVVTGCDPDAVGKIVVPESVEGYPVTRVASKAFMDCTKIESIILPDCMKEIGTNAFYNCSNMTSIELGKGIYNIDSRAFMNCSKLKKITFYDCLTWFQSNSFVGCDELESIEVIGNNSTFYSDDGVLFRKRTDQYYQKIISLVAYPHGRTGSYTIPSGVGYIENHAFYGTKGLTDIIFASDVKSIGDLAFARCIGLTEISLPDKITSINYHAFDGCTRLKSVYIPENVTTINSGAFMNCSNLELLSISSRVTTIWENAFEGCANLSRFEVSEYNNYYSTENDVLFNKDKTEILICSRKKNGIYTIPTGVKCISESAFYDCSSITALEIPLSVVHMYDASFNGNSNLTDVYYEGDENDKESMSIRDPAILNATWHFNSYNNSGSTEADDESAISTEVRYFCEWDSENQIIYWGQMDYVGSQVTEETNTSFMEKVDSFVGTYVLVETKTRVDDMTAPDTVISIKKVESKIGTVTSADAETITIDGVDYVVPENLIIPSGFVSNFVLYHLYEGELVSLETLEMQKGTLICWNTDTRELSIETEDLDDTASVYTLSTLADEETITFLGDFGEKYSIKVSYVADSMKIVYRMQFAPTDTTPEFDGWGLSDEWSFNNYSVKTIPLTNEDYQAIIHDLDAVHKEIIDALINKSYNGQCYGLATSSCLVKRDVLALNTIQQGITSLYESKKNDMSMSVIGYYFMNQYTSRAQSAVKSFTALSLENQLKMLIKTSVPYVLSFGCDGWGAHAITVIGCDTGYWEYHGHNYDTRVLTYDSNYGWLSSSAEESYLYYNSNTLEWEIPNYYGYGISSDGNGYLKRACGDVEILNSLNLAEDRDEYAAWLRNQTDTAFEISTIYGNYRIEGESSSVGDELLVYYDEGFNIESPTTPTLNIKLQELSNYTIIPDETTMLDISVLYPNYYISATSDTYDSLSLEVDGALSASGLNGAYGFVLSANEGYTSLPWYTIEFSGEDATEISVEITEEGVLLTGDNLSDVAIKGTNDEGAIELTLSSDKESILVIESEDGNMAVLEDTDGDGNYDKDITHVCIYGLPCFTWSEENNCVAVFTCDDCKGVQSEICIIINETIPATESEDGTVVYTATVEFGGQKYTSTKAVILPTTGHMHIANGEWKFGDEQHWHNCSCGEKLNVEAHSYTADTDATCNVCGYWRTIASEDSDYEDDSNANMEKTDGSDGTSGATDEGDGNSQDSSGTIDASTGNSESDKTLPATGDNSYMGFLLSLMWVAIVAIAMLLIVTKRNDIT